MMISIPIRPSRSAPHPLVIAVVTLIGSMVGFVTLASDHSEAQDGPSTWFISPAGDDSNPGNSAQRPVATIAVAIERAAPGDEVRLLTGEHAEATLSDVGGTRAAPIRIVGDPGASISATGDGTDALTMIGVHHIVLVSVTISEAADGLVVRDSQGVRVNGLTVTDVAGTAVRIEHNSTDTAVDGCRIEGAREGVSIGSVVGDETRNTSIGGCTITDATAAAVSVRPGSDSVNITTNRIASSRTGDGIVVSSPASVVNNVVTDVGGRGVLVASMNGPRAGRTRIEHNTIFDAAVRAYQNTTAGTPRVVNNLGIGLDQNRKANAADFRSATTGDLRLDETSGAIDTGAPSRVDLDHDGTRRPIGAGPDFGAYESPVVRQPDETDEPTPSSSSSTPEPVVETADTPSRGDSDERSTGIPTGLGEPAEVERPSADDEDSDALVDADNEANPPDENVDNPRLADGTGRSTPDSETAAVSPTPETNPPLARIILDDEQRSTPPLAIAVAALAVALVVAFLRWCRARSRSSSTDPT